MNILQSFVGCLYPESIRTDSIESMDHNDFANCRFPQAKLTQSSRTPTSRESQASNIDGYMQQVSKGELQLTEKDLIYFRPSKEPIRWPLEYIRRYGYNDGEGTFYLESGRRSKTGEAIFAFRVDSGEDLVNRLKEKIDKSPSMNSLPKSDLCRITHTVGATNQRVPNSPSSDDGRRRDAYTSTTTEESEHSTPATNRLDGVSDPLSYTSIDFDTTKALNESAQAHAANRVK